MGFYCGFGTKQNKIRWGIVAVFGFLSFCLLIATFVKNGQCNKRLNRANIHRQADFQEQCDKNDLSGECEGILHACGSYFSCLMAFTAFAIATSIPLYVMCCCSSPPVMGHPDQPAIGLAVHPPPGADYKAASAAQYAAESDAKI